MWKPYNSVVRAANITERDELGSVTLSAEIEVIIELPGLVTPCGKHLSGEGFMQENGLVWDHKRREVTIYGITQKLFDKIRNPVTGSSA